MKTQQRWAQRIKLLLRKRMKLSWRENVDTMEEMKEVYDEELKTIANKNALTKNTALASNITQTMGASRGEENIDGSTNE